MPSPSRFGAYTIREPLGAGGMASVDLADWTPLEGPQRRVALKRLFPHIAANPDLVAMFIDEARLARYLKHPNIAQVFEFGRIGGTYFIAFEFVQGPTVQQLARQCDLHVGYMPVPIVLEIGIQICDALHHAHNLCDEEGLPLGIVHRDISPQNLIVSTAGFVKLIDFGLAKAKMSSVESQSGIIKGKLSYIAPEYLDGKLDVRCDLWAVGVVLHELLTGRKLFEAPDDFKMIERVRKMAIPPASRSRAEVLLPFDDILYKALERDPRKRWQNAAALRAALVAHAKEYPPVTRSQLVAWVEWAFGQNTKARQDSGLSALHEIIESKQVVPVDEHDEVSALERLPASSAAAAARQRESVAAMRIGDAMLSRRRDAPLWPWIALVVVAVILIGLAALKHSGKI
ncbi:MAG TPA: serine/threonine-protein kinase [Kofleriaceae bacterium]|nr:serine/threonine-protein kinase [Kofleriaceae bacterium]